MNTINRSPTNRLGPGRPVLAAGSPPAWRQALKTRWLALQPREQLLLTITGIVVGLALLWLVAIAPALSVLRNAPAQIEQLEAQRQQMTALAHEAASLRGQDGTRPADARTALTTTTQNALGQRGPVTDSGDQVQVRLDQVQASELVDWLTQLRVNARVTPSQADLSGSSTGQWRGTVSFSLPPSSR